MTKLPIFPDRFTAKEAADILGIREETLAVWRSTKRYPIPYIKIGRNVFYRGDDLRNFIKQCTIEVNET